MKSALFCLANLRLLRSLPELIEIGTKLDQIRIVSFFAVLGFLHIFGLLTKHEVMMGWILASERKNKNYKWWVFLTRLIEGKNYSFLFTDYKPPV